MNFLLVVALLNTFVLICGQHNHRERLSGSTETRWGSPMEIDIRSMHKYCSGVCTFLPENCEKDTDEFVCSKILSIQKFKPPCDEFKNSSTPDRKNLCARQDNLFIISLLRDIAITTIRSRRILFKRHGGQKIKCNLQPFVAVAFSTNQDQTITPTDLKNGKLGDVFYVCVVEHPYVTTWIKPINPSERIIPSCINHKETALTRSSTNDSKRFETMQLLETQPYPPMGASVLWSKVKLRVDQYAMGCKFIVSNLQDDLTVNFGHFKEPNMAPQAIPLFEHKFIKLATGFAYVRAGIIEDIIFNTGPRGALTIDKSLNDEASLDAFPGISDWNSPLLDYPKGTVPKEDEEAKKNRETQHEVDSVYKLCEKKKALCYVRQDEKNCMVKKKCHFLAAFESLDGEKFKKLRLSMIVQQVKLKGFSPHVHTKLWGGIGLSNDTKMGKDLVFLCVAYGELVWTRATYNTDQQNMFLREEACPEPVVNISSKIDGMSDDDPNSNAVYGDTFNDLTLCKINISVPEPVNIKAFYYVPLREDTGDANKWPILHFNIQEHEYYVLIAQGTGAFPPLGMISYHTYSTVSDIKFSKKIYLKHTGGVGFKSAWTISYIFSFTAFLIFNHKFLFL